MPHDRARHGSHDGHVQQHRTCSGMRMQHMLAQRPGFAKEQFKEYLEAEAVRREVRPLIENKEKIVLAPASSAYKHSLKEVLSCPGIASRIKDTKAAREVGALQDFYDLLSTDSTRAFYGPGHVFAAAEM
ncbi:Protein pelota, partial [Tetrabaena socialis]